MRFVALLALLSVPLFAGDKEPAPLERARELFRDDDMAARDEGGRIARAELRKVLAPLLKDLDSEDAEVRRRVRELLLAFVPNPPRPEPPQPVPNVRLVNRLRWNVVAKARDPREKEATKLIKRFGLQGGTAVRALPQGEVRVPVAGYFVRKAKRNAQRHGLKEGDLILKVNGKRIAKELDVLLALGKGGIDAAVFTVIRGHDEVVLKPKR